MSRIRSRIEMHRMGTVANVVRYVTAPDGTHHLVCQGEQRFQVMEFLGGWPFLVARVLRIPESLSRTPEIEARFLNLRGKPWKPRTDAAGARELIGCGADDRRLRRAGRSGRRLYGVKPEEKQEILETIDVAARMEKVSRVTGAAYRGACGCSPGDRPADQGRARRAPARSAAARADGGDPAGSSAKARRARTPRSPRLSKAIANAGMPKEVEEQARKELRRLKRMPESAGRIRHGAQLSRLAGRAALEAARGTARSTSSRRAASWTRTTTASRRLSGGSSNFSPFANLRR